MCWLKHFSFLHGGKLYLKHFPHFSAGPLCSMLVERFGCRVTVMVGGLLSGLGMAVSTLARTITHIYITSGITGQDLHAPTLSLLHQHEGSSDSLSSPPQDWDSAFLSSRQWLSWVTTLCAAVSLLMPCHPPAQRWAWAFYPRLPMPCSVSLAGVVASWFWVGCC